MGLTVVADCAIVASDGDQDLSRRGDGLITVGHFEGNRLEVGVRVFELVRHEAHIRGAHIGAFGLGGAVEREVVVHVVEIRARGGGVAGDRVLLAVIYRGVVGADDGHGRIDRVDGLVSVCDVERDGLEVGVGVRELPRRQAHVRGAGVGARGLGGAGEREVLLYVVEVSAGGGGVAGDLVLRAVVVGRVVRAHDGYGHVDRVDLLVAVGDVEGDVGEVRVRVRELLRSQAHVRGAGVGARSRIGTGEREVLGDVVQLAIGSCRIAGD